MEITRRFLFRTAAPVVSTLTAACSSKKFGRPQTTWEEEIAIGRAITVLPGGQTHPESGSLVLRFDTDRLPSGLDVVEGRVVIPVPFSVSVRRAVDAQGLPSFNYFDIASVLTLGQEDRKIPSARLLLTGSNRPGLNTFFITWTNNQPFNWTGATLPRLVTPTPGNRG